MSVSQWPNIIKVQVLESSGAQAVGAFNLAEKMQLKHIVLWFRRVGTAGGSERFRLKVFGNTDLTGAIATSAYFNLADMEAMATNWLGWARFDFSRENLQASRWYYLAVEPDSYTRNGTTFYVAALLDEPSSYYRDSGGGEHKAANFRIVGYT